MEGIQKQDEENFADLNEDEIEVKVEETKLVDPDNGACAVEVKQEPIEQTAEPVKPTDTAGGNKIKKEPQQEVNTNNWGVLLKDIQNLGPEAYVTINGKLYQLKTQSSEVAKSSPVPPEPVILNSPKSAKPNPLLEFKCTKCKFETSDSSVMRGHLKAFHSCDSNQNLFVCQLCPYKTADSTVYDRHLDIHKGPREIKMYQCNECAYETIRHRSMKFHAVFHQNISEVRMFQCDKCPFRSQKREKVKTHMQYCHVEQSFTSSYTSKLEALLKNHIHEQPRENKVYKCEQCSFETKLLGDLNQHVSLIHKKGEWFSSEMEELQKQEEDNFSNVDGNEVEVEETKLVDPDNGNCAVEIKQEPIEQMEEPTHTDDGVKIKTEPQQEVNTVNSAVLENSTLNIVQGTYLIINGKLVKLKTHPPPLHSIVVQQATTTPVTTEPTGLRNILLCKKCNFPSKDLETHRNHIRTHRKSKRCPLQIKLPTPSRLEAKTTPKRVPIPRLPPKPIANITPKQNLDPPSILKCDKCNFQTNNSFLMQSHVMECYSSQLIFRCQMCSYKTYESRDYIWHLDIHRKANECET